MKASQTNVERMKGNTMNAKKLLISSALIASLTVGAGAALAQDDTGTTPPDAPPALGMQHRFGPQGQFGPGRRGPEGQFGPQGRGGRFGGGLRMGAEMMDLAMEYTGLSLTELQTARRDGQTLAELIEANGQSVDAFVEAAVAAASARIDERLANAQTQAEAFKSTLADRITAQVNGEQYTPPVVEADA